MGYSGFTGTQISTVKVHFTKFAFGFSLLIQVGIDVIHHAVDA